MSEQITTPDQPDGIEDDSTTIPDLRKAAERVTRYVEATGDGLYDVVDGAPLYGRDLEALARLVRAPHRFSDDEIDRALPGVRLRWLRDAAEDEDR